MDRIDLLTDLLIAERKNILIVGEVNFTLTVAFASLRKYQYKKPVTEQLRQFQIERVSEHDWEGITSSRYEPAGDELKMENVGSERVYCKPPPMLSQVKVLCIGESIKYYLHHAPDLWVPTPNPSVLQSIVHLQDVPSSCAWQFKVDALTIPSHLLPRGIVIWFQCPYKKQADDVKKFLKDFLLKNAREVKPDSYVCIGITRKLPFVKNYSLDSLLGEHLKAQDCSTRVLKYYRFLGADDVLIKKLLSFGYRHECSKEGKDIHEEIIGHHLTLVFKRKHD